MKAIDILQAAKKTFENYGDEKYAVSKANTFLRRCGAKIELGPDQDIPEESVKSVAYAMLDADSEKVFWSNMEANEKGEPK
jgi:hypothetical protein